MTIFLIRLRNFLSWKLEEFSKYLVKGLTKLVNKALKPELGSFKEKQIGIFVHCLVYYPFLRIKKVLSLNKDVEEHYDDISGSYVQNLTKNKRKQWGVVEGEVKQTTYAQYCVEGMHERMHYMEKYGPFANILEVGCGELTTFFNLIDVMELDRPDLHAIDLSLNRLRHGRNFINSKNIEVKLAKASAFALPYPDDFFDIVFTSHCLEWMPKHMFKNAVDEICRVSKKHVFLFEPTYEYSSFLQKMKMRTHSYMRGIVPYLKNKQDIQIQRSSIMKHSYNAFNQTSCHHLIVQSTSNTQSYDNALYSCPKCHTALELQNKSYFCYDCHLGFPIFDDIPVLDVDYALGVSRISS